MCLLLAIINKTVKIIRHLLSKSSSSTVVMNLGYRRRVSSRIVPQESQVVGHSRGKLETSSWLVQDVTRQVGTVVVEQARQGDQGAVSVPFRVGERYSKQFLCPQRIGTGLVEGQHVEELGVLTGLENP